MKSQCYGVNNKLWTSHIKKLGKRQLRMTSCAELTTLVNKTGGRPFNHCGLGHSNKNIFAISTHTVGVISTSEVTLERQRQC